MTFAEKCRHYRTALNLTQAQVATLTGISKRTYLYYEQGEKFPRKRDTLQKLADCFGININQLIVEDDEIWYQLRQQRPAEERTKELLQEIRTLFAEQDVSAVPDILAFAEEAAALCQAYITQTTARTDNILQPTPTKDPPA